MENTETKVCSKCGKIKPLISFRIRTPKQNKCIYPQSYCIDCEKEYNKVYCKNNNLKLNNYRKKYRKDNIRKSLYSSAKKRALKRNIKFDLDIDDIIIPQKCPILDIFLQIGDGGVVDQSPTLDRIDSNLGYVKGNVMVISYRANMIKNYGNATEHRKVADYIEKNLPVDNEDYSI